MKNDKFTNSGFYKCAERLDEMGNPVPMHDAWISPCIKYRVYLYPDGNYKILPNNNDQHTIDTYWQHDPSNYVGTPEEIIDVYNRLLK